MMTFMLTHVSGYKKGYIDYITPQIYWNIGFTPAAYDILVDWWVKETNNKPIHLYIGQAVPIKLIITPSLLGLIQKNIQDKLH